MKRLITLILLVSASMHVFGQTTPGFNWAFRLGTDSTEIPYQIGKDFAGNIYIAGEFRETLDFDPTAATANLSPASTTAEDVFVAKYTAAGAFQWAFRIGGSLDEWLNDLHVDSAGNIYIVGGLVSPTVDLDPGAGVTNVTNTFPVPFSAYVAKYNSSGFFQWGFRLGGATDTSYVQCRAVRTSRDGSEIYVTGYSTDSLVDYSPGVGVAKIASRPDGDIFLAKYNNLGALQWIWSIIGNGGFESGWKLGIHPNGNTVYLEGFFQSDSVDFGGPGWTLYRSGTFGNQDIFTSVYSRTGIYLGTLAVGGTNNEFAGGVSADTFGNIYATGSYFGTITNMAPFGPGVVPLTSAGNRDAFYSMYRPNGALKSAFTIGGTSVDNVRGLYTESSGATCLTGEFAGTTTFKPAGLTLSSVGGNYDAYVMRYDTTQVITHALQLGSGTNDLGMGSVVNGKTLYTAGIFSGTVDFDPAAATASLTSSNGSFDVYTGRYNLCGTPVNTIINKTICAGSGYLFKGIARTTNGTYLDTIKLASGCDSMVTLNLTVTPLATTSISIASNPVSTNICPTTVVTFTATAANGGAGSVYQWRKNGTAVGTNSSTLVLNNIANNDTIYCVYTAGDSCVSQKVVVSNKIKFNVSTPNTFSAIVTSNAASTSICTNQSVTFTATPTNGGTAPTYTWKKNSATVGFNATYSTSSIANNDTIYCIVAGNDSCATPSSVISNKMVFTVSPNVVPAVTITSSLGNTICSGANVTFSVNTSSNLGTSPTYFWKKNGVVVGNQPTYNNSSLIQGDNITLTVKSNAVCAVPDSVTSSSIIMNVTPSVTPTLGISGPASICVGNNATYNVNPTNPGTNPTYQWKVNGAVVGSGPSYSSTSFANGDSITCTMTSNANCATTTTANSNKISIQVNSLSSPSVTIAGSSATLCSGTSITYTPTPINGGSAPTYQWKVNGINVAVGSTYTATLNGNDSVSCVMTSNSTCATSSTATSNKLGIVQAVVPTVSINSPTTTICAGESLTFTASITNGGTNPTFQWYKNGIIQIGETGSTYTKSNFIGGDNIYVELTSNATCAAPTKVNSNSKSITISASVTPTVSINAPSTAICEGTNVTITASPGNGGAAPTYQWKVNGVNSGGVTTNNVFNISTLANNDTIRVVMTSNSTCAITPNATSNNLIFIVNTKAVPTVTISPSPNQSSVCSGTPMTFIAGSTNAGSSPTFSWTVDGNAQASTTNIMGKTLTNAGSNPIQATILVTLNVTPGACVTTTSVLSSPLAITVNPNVTPTLSISTANTSVCSGVNTNFTASPTNCGTSPTFQWKLNGANVGTGGTSYSNNALANNDNVSCVVTPIGGCFTAASANSNVLTMTVTPSVTPTISITANPGTTICQDANVTFNSNNSFGGTSPTYQWKVNGANVGNNSDIFVTNTIKNNDQVTLSFTSSALCAIPATVVSNTLNMQVKPKPKKPTINRIDANTLQCSEIGDSYEWKKDGKVVTSGNGNRTLTITAGIAGYTVAVVSSSCTSDISEPFNTSSVLTFAEMGVRVYPNPASDKIYVYLPTTLMAIENTFRLLTIAGEQIQVEVVKTNGGVIIPVEGLASGVYLLEIENKEGKALNRINIQQ